jgi:hypothetical protein
MGVWDFAATHPLASSWLALTTAWALLKFTHRDA